jgi:arsenate reductase
MAEGLLRHMAGDRYDVASAGTAPKGLHPKTAEVMGEVGIDVSGHTSKDLEPFVGRDYDYVITVCDRAKEQCPVFPGARPLHWCFDDPANAPADQQTETFRRVRDEIAEHLRSFVSAASA